MKKFIPLFVISLFIFQSSLLAQSLVVQQMINSVKQDSLIYFVRELSGAVPTIINGTTQTIQSRHKNQPGNALAETYIKQKLQSYGLSTTIQSFSSTGKNVFATQIGTEFPNKKYIICAHFDDMPPGTTAPGADDNASGTAAVIEAARILSQYSFPFTIIYALWDEEEQGLVGSYYYANQAASAGDSILGVINMDMIAFDSDNDGVCNVHNRVVGSSVEIYQKMVEVNMQYGINLNIVSRNPGITASDHASFWSKGYGAILLIENDDTDFNPHYHTVNDLVQYFNQPYFTKMAKLALGTLAVFALNLNLEIEHTPIASVITPQPISTSAFISTGLEIGAGNLSPRLYYRTKQSGGQFGQFVSVVGTPTESGSYNFIIPEQSLGTVVQYYIAAQDANSSIVKTLPAGGSGFNPPGSTPPPTFFQFFVAELTIALNDQANNMNNWTSDGAWNITTTKYVSAPSSFTDSPGGNYAANTTAILRLTNPISFSDVLGAILEFDTQWVIENSWDYGQVQISTNNGTTWIPLAGQFTNLGTGSFQPNGQPLYDGSQLTWVHEIIDISGYANQSLYLRFYFRSDGSIQNDGWYIDNVKISVYNSTIPVELVSFSAEVVNNSVQLNWRTASEINNKGFEIQRSQMSNVKSQNGWERIGFVNGNGTSTKVQTYTFTDNNPVNGKLYYRLKQIDFDGMFEYSNIIEIDFAPILNFVLHQNYPNPFNPSTKISWQSPVGSWQTLKVYDVIGNEVATLINEYREAGSYEIEFNANNLPSGMYFYKLETGKFTSVKKMLLVR